MKGSLYLIPCGLSESPLSEVLPASNFELIQKIGFVFAENTRSARRFMRNAGFAADMPDEMFYEIGKHADMAGAKKALIREIETKDIGVVSEAGCPGIADPGAAIVAMAHEAGIKVVPMVGPSSILLALMASGLNGQNFVFHGYLPIKEERKTVLKKLEDASAKNGQAQIFIETPYRNQQLLADMIKYCHASTKLCVAADITSPAEEIATLPMNLWKTSNIDINKRPCIFILQASR
jgi:16S rRNA (cytidine1402-2'-O)-methyltransferase